MAALTGGATYIDDIPEAQFFTPPLTTVRQPIAEMGRIACDRLLALALERHRSRARLRTRYGA